MNKRRVFGAVLLVVILLVVAVLPASAGATKTPFTGMCSLPPLEVSSPDARVWYAGETTHMRDDISGFNCTFSDDRLDGVLHGVTNWNVREYYSDEEPYWWVLGHQDGAMTILDAFGNVLWEGGHVVTYYEPWKATGHAWLHGRGPYEGLQVQSSLWWDLLAGVGPSWEGEILDPGK